MLQQLQIAGTNNPVRNLSIGETQTFNGAGTIRASAVHRKSKSHYKTTIITEREIYVRTNTGLSTAIEDLQIFYNSLGCLAFSPPIGKKGA